MRKRSGAIDSDTPENYLKLAILSQKSHNLFYSGSVYEGEEEKQDSQYGSRRYSIEIVNFDYEPINTAESYQMQSSSFPPKDHKFEKESIRQKKAIKMKFDGKRCAKDVGNFEENPSNSIFSQKSIEKENLRTLVSKIMVIGEKSTGKKTLINTMFRRTQQLREDNTSAFTKGLRFPPFILFSLKVFDESSQNSCFDLICKSVQLNEREKMTYKFWIQNLSNEKFDNIINVYYKTVSLFIFVYDVAKPESLDKIKKVADTIKKSLGKNNINALLVAMNPQNIQINAVDFSEIEDFKNKSKFEFFKNIYENDQENARIFEFIASYSLNFLQSNSNGSTSSIC